MRKSDISEPEVCLSVKRDLFIWQKRPMKCQKTPMKGQKRPIHMAKEAYRMANAGDLFVHTPAQLDEQFVDEF